MGAGPKFAGRSPPTPIDSEKGEHGEASENDLRRFPRVQEPPE